MMYQIRLLTDGLGDLTPAFELKDLKYFQHLNTIQTWTKQSQNSLSFLASDTTSNFFGNESGDALNNTLANTPKAYICSEVSSTFDLAHKLCELQILNDWDIVIAYSQNNGRGQLRSNWVSMPGNLYASLKLPLAPLFMNDESTALLGQYLAKAFGKLGVPVRTKWVNDLLIEKNGQFHKLVGILLEEKNNNLIMGFGVNINHAPALEELTIPTNYPPAKLLDITDKFPDPLDLCLRLVEILFLTYNEKSNANSSINISLDPIMGKYE